MPAIYFFIDVIKNIGYGIPMNTYDSYQFRMTHVSVLTNGGVAYASIKMTDMAYLNS